MALIRWENKFLVGIPEVDEHAKQFIILLNLIDREFDGGGGGDSRAPLLSTLVSLSRFLFEYEERLMCEIKSPKYLEHKNAHDAFLARLAAIPSPTPGEQAELLKFLGKWAQLHFDGGHAELRAFAGYHFPK